MIDLYTTIIDRLQRSRAVLIVSHKQPDGDTAGASLALAHYLQQQSIAVTCFCVDTIGPTLTFLPGSNQLGPHHHAWNQPELDTVVVVDCGDLRHAGVQDVIAQKRSTITVINIDHHATNEQYGDINYVDANASSTCELVFRLLNSVQAIDKMSATCLLTGVITDTGSFSNLATTATAVDTAARLLTYGPNLDQISKRTLRHRPYATLKLWGRALQRLHDDPATGMVVTVLTYDDIVDCGADTEAVSGISNFLNSLDQAAHKAVLVLTQNEPGVIKGSLRTTNPLLDVAQFAKLYGGGGHHKAAGFTIKGTLQFTPHGYSITPIQS
ncbi:MAG: DHH family phosphoesterase [Candidatus Kerfeldbacteria bacterium]|nr:DHH family phosphoesterase [Candidatus Kerfeldbacteria bacterium]